MSSQHDPLLTEALGDDERFDFRAKLVGHPERARAAIDGDLTGALSTVYLDVNTDICNHNCTFCDGFYRSLTRATLPWSRLERLVEELRELSVLGVVIAGDRGEPLLHPNIVDLLEALHAADIAIGLYTNGSVYEDRVLEALRHVAWLRISADAATVDTHRRLHVVPNRRDDFSAVLLNIERLAPSARSLGVSFVLDATNVHEIEQAAELFLSRGAHFIEYKPKYLPSYSIDSAFLLENRQSIRAAIRRARRRFGERVITNNQVESLLRGGDLPTLEVPRRPCLTSRLRLVVSSHGCYSCTPYRGEAERRVGDIMESSLREVVTSARRARVDALTCTRRCAYHDQNELLLEMQRRDEVLAGPPSLAPQHRFI